MKYDTAFRLIAFFLIGCATAEFVLSGQIAEALLCASVWAFMLAVSEQLRLVRVKMSDVARVVVEGR